MQFDNGVSANNEWRTSELRGANNYEGSGQKQFRSDALKRFCQIRKSMLIP